MATLFEPSVINDMSLANRLVKLATWENMCQENGRPTKKLIRAIEVSSGNSASGTEGPLRTKITGPDREAWNIGLARRVKKTAHCPVMVVGGFRSPEVMAKAIREDGMDYLAISRPFIREPHLANRWQGGDQSPAKCISCNDCFKPGIEEGGRYCFREK